MKGPAIGAWLYTSGGFSLPFLSVGVTSTIVSVFLVLAIPSGVLKHSDGKIESEAIPILPSSNITEDSSTTKKPADFR